MERKELLKKLNDRIVNGTDHYSCEYRSEIRMETLNVLDDFGKTNVMVAVEELSELQKELIKYLRGNNNYLGIYEEIADVEIMIDYIKDIFQLNADRVEHIKDIKYERQHKRNLQHSSCNA